MGVPEADQLVQVNPVLPLHQDGLNVLDQKHFDQLSSGNLVPGRQVQTEGLEFALKQHNEGIQDCLVGQGQARLAQEEAQGKKLGPDQLLGFEGWYRYW